MVLIVQCIFDLDGSLIWAEILTSYVDQTLFIGVYPHSIPDNLKRLRMRANE